MQKYVKIALDSRGIDIDKGIAPYCERCNKNKAVDVDHIEGRGGKRNFENRMYDIKNLILLCRECHQNKGGFEWKQMAKEIVLSRITKPDEDSPKKDFGTETLGKE